MANNDFDFTNHTILDIDNSTQQPINDLPQQYNAPFNDNLAPPHQQSTETSTRNFWTIEYYQKYFNVTATDVVERIKRSMIPYGTQSYLLSHIRPNPDLYGPFWICVTLVFAIAISGNLANYFHTASSVKYHWKYDFHLVSIAATCIFLYAWLLPLSIWGALKWTNKKPTNNQDVLIEPENTLGLLEIISVYGYSLSIFVPVAFLGTIQIAWFQWALVSVAACLSGGILLCSILPAISGKYKFIYMSIILCMHLLIAAVLLLYFFYNPSPTNNYPNHSPIPPVTTHSTHTTNQP